MGRGRGPSLLALVQHSTWRSEGRKSFSLILLCQILIQMNLKANVLINQYGHARLTDFGLTSTVLGNQSAFALPGASQTIATMWTAPETSEGGLVTKAGDVFAFAMVVAEVRKGGVFVRRSSLQTIRLEQTFTEHPLTVEYYAIVSTGGRPEQPETLNDDLWNLMECCWNRDPGKRPTSFELVDYLRPS